MFLIRLLSRLPLSVLFVLSDFLFIISYYIAGYRRKLVQRNLRNSFPGKTAAELKKIEKTFYRNLCDYAVESLKLVTMPREELIRRMRLINNGIVEKYRAANQPILFLASHQFNWEWLLVSASASLPMSVDFVYQPVQSRFVDSLILKIRTRFGAYPIKRDEVARQLVKRKDIVRAVASVADQYPGYGRDKKYMTTFLNQETVFFMGANQMAILTQYPTVYYQVKRLKRGYYEAHLVVVATPPYPRDSESVIENYVREVEKTIRMEPAGWLWSHNRWKTRHLEEKN